MATVRQIATKFTVNGIAAVKSGFKSLGGAVASFSHSAVTNIRTVGVALARVTFVPLMKGAKLAFAGIAAGAVIAKVKIAALASTALSVTKDVQAQLQTLNKLANATGASVQDLSAIRFALKANGSDPDDIFNALTGIAKNFGEIRKQIEAADASFQKTKSWNLAKAQASIRQGDVSGALGYLDQINSDSSSSPAAIKERMSVIESTLRETGPGGRVERMPSLQRLPAAQRERALSSYRLQLVEEYKSLQQAGQDMEDSMGPANRALQELAEKGLDTTKVLKGDVESLLAISDAMAKVTDRTEKLRLATAIFGDNGKKMLPILENGRAGINEYRAKMDRYGATPTDADMALSNSASSSEDDLEQAKAGVKLQVFRGVLPMYTALNEKIAEFLARNRDLIAQYLTSAFDVVRAVAEDAMKLFEGNSDFESGLFKMGVWVFEWSKSLYTQIQTIYSGVKALALETLGEVQKVLSGQDSQWGWLNKARDAFLYVKRFAEDAFAVFTGGDATKFTWLNDLRDSALSFWKDLKTAFGMFKSILDSIHSFIKPVLDFFGTNVMTAALFVGMLRLSGILGLMLGSLKLIGTGFAAFFTSTAAGAAATTGAMGALATGFAALATKLGMSAAALVGRLNVGVMAVIAGWQVGKMFAEAHNAVAWAKAEQGMNDIAADARAKDAQYLQDKMARDPDFGIVYGRTHGYDTGRKTSSELQAIRDNAAETGRFGTNGSYIVDAAEHMNKPGAPTNDPFAGRTYAVELTVGGAKETLFGNGNQGLAAELARLSRAGGE